MSDREHLFLCEWLETLPFNADGSDKTWVLRVLSSSDYWHRHGRFLD